MDSDGIEKARYARLACSHGDKRLFSLPQTKLFLHYDPEEEEPTTTVEQEGGGGVHVLQEVKWEIKQKV